MNTSHLIPVILAAGLAACASKQRQKEPSPTATATTARTAPGNTPAAVDPAQLVARDLPADTAALPIRRVHFAFDTAALSQGAEDALGQTAAALAQRADVSLYVDGHCDERGSRAYNRALGLRRAQAAVYHLTALGINPTRLDVVSFGKERPRQAGSNAQAWAENRCVEFRLHGGEASLVIEDGALVDDRGRPLVRPRAVVVRPQPERDPS